MFCPNCGKEIVDNAKFCSSCGNAVGNETAYINTMQTTHEVPKCTCCGHIGPWKKGPILRPIDFVIGVVLLIFGFIPGIIYLGVVAAIRSNEKNREKICTKCNARNLFTYIY